MGTSDGRAIGVFSIQTAAQNFLLHKRADCDGMRPARREFRTRIFHPERMTKPARKAHPANLRKLNQQGVLDALRACESKKAGDVALLEMDKTASAFTDYF